jgi:hypothetical protein
MGRADALKPSRHKGGQPPLSRAELPRYVSLARSYLIGKLVQGMAEGVTNGRIVETDPSPRERGNRGIRREHSTRFNYTANTPPEEMAHERRSS